MKIQYKSLVAALGLGAALSACSSHDLINEVAEPGQEVPVAYWEVGSTACKAGESFSFSGKYNVSPGKQVAYTEVWYRVKRDESAAATVKLAGAALSYTKTYTSNDTMRAYQPVVRFAAADGELDAEAFNYQYVIRGEVPVSRTLSPVTWNDAEEWDAARFESYYPAEFAKEFKAEVIDYLTKDSTYYNSLRTVYLNYPFTNAQFADVNAKHGVNLPANIDMSTEDQGAGEKSDLWYSTTEPSDAALTGYYYKELVGENTVVHQIGINDVTVAEDGTLTYKGFPCYPVYDAAAWVFCRYDDDLGKIVTTVRAKYMPAFKELLQSIKFEEWIYDSANKVYKVEFSRKYSLDAQFRVYDTDGEEGVANDVRVISVN